MNEYNKKHALVHYEPEVKRRVIWMSVVLLLAMIDHYKPTVKQEAI